MDDENAKLESIMKLARQYGVSVTINVNLNPPRYAGRGAVCYDSGSMSVMAMLRQLSRLWPTGT